MESQGWTFYVRNSTAETTHNTSCGTSAWFDDEHFLVVILKTFKKSGKAKLNYGNCNSQGETAVYVNDKKVDSAALNISAREVDFDYEDGDNLIIKADDMGIINLNTFLVCRGKCAVT